MFKALYNKSNSLRYNLGLGKYTSLLNKNRKLEESAKDVKRCFILATGPSIKNQDLSKLKNEFCISVSNFFVHPLFGEIQPAYHVFAGIHSPLTKEHIATWWHDATSHMANSRSKILLHARDEKLREELGVFKNHEIHYYLDGGDFPVNFAMQIPPIQTVVHIAIYLSIYLGIKEIYLLGVDHNWLLHFGKSMHFYKEEQHALTRANYSEWNGVSDIGAEFESHAVLWKIYRNIRTEALKNDISIYNATPGSLLDIFPRIDLNSIINP